MTATSQSEHIGRDYSEQQRTVPQRDERAPDDGTLAPKTESTRSLT